MLLDVLIIEWTQNGHEIFKALKKRVLKPSNKWSGRRDSNSRQSAWKADTLPTELRPLKSSTIFIP